MFEKRTLVGSSVIPIRFVFFMWLFFVGDYVYSLEFLAIPLIPRTWGGLLGIITTPFVHADPAHLVSNTIPILILGITIFYNYPVIAKRVFLACYLFTNVLVWLLGRGEAHIGASGMIYAMVTFAVLFGLLRRDTKALIISTIVLLFYGSIFYGVLPSNSLVSWESHLSGTVVGATLAIYFFKTHRT